MYLQQSRVALEWEQASQRQWAVWICCGIVRCRHAPVAELADTHTLTWQVVLDIHAGPWVLEDVECRCVGGGVDIGGGNKVADPGIISRGKQTESVPKPARSYNTSVVMRDRSSVTTGAARDYSPNPHINKMLQCNGRCCQILAYSSQDERNHQLPHSTHPSDGSVR